VSFLKKSYGKLPKKYQRYVVEQKKKMFCVQNVDFPYFCRLLDRKTEGTFMPYLNTRLDELTVIRVCVECWFSAHLLCVIYMSSGQKFRCDEGT